MLLHAALLLALAADTVEERFAPPAGFVRAAVAPGSFGAWLRTRPLLAAGSPVRAFDGRIVAAPWAAAVIDLDIGDRDLHQCADSALRLYAEYRRAHQRSDDLAFHATSGDLLPWRRWSQGMRPRVDKKNRVSWTQTALADTSERAWRGWLEQVFVWAGSASLHRDTQPVTGELLPGDLLVIPGSPGHVVVVVDVAAGAAQRRLLLGQGFMPAQSFHVLQGHDGPWFVVADDGSVTVPSWRAPFPAASARRFPD